MGYRVLKFGGTSLGAPERVRRAVELVEMERALSPVAIVVSAMGDTTDRLLDAIAAAASGDCEAAERLVDRIADLGTENGSLAEGDGGGEPSPVTAAVHALLSPLRKLLYGVSLVREQTAQTTDLVLSFGERMSATVMAEVLSASDVPAVYVDARDWTVTDAAFGCALVDWEASKAKLDALRETWGDAVPVVTGFLGTTPDGRTTTLGRNGSDYTATLLARGLDADEVVRWTDVSGVMTADPGIVRDAYPLSRLSYMEALELANFGARVFHPRTMIPLIESRIPMRIRNTMHPGEPGTVIDDHGADDEDSATSVTSLENLAMLDIQWRFLPRTAQVGERVLRALDEAGITVWMANQAAHGQAVAVVVPAGDVEAARAAIEAALDGELRRGDVQPIGVQVPVTLLSLVAEAMGRTVNVAGRFFHALGAIGVNVRAAAQGASSRSISAVIAAEDTRVAVRAVHAAFNFAHQEVNLLVLGCGTVGGELLRQIHEHAGPLAREHGAHVRVAGVATSRRCIFDEHGIALDDWSGALAAAPEEDHDPMAVLDALSRLPVPMLVDCTAAPDMEPLYGAALSRGIHVIAANKKPLTGPIETYRALAATARANHRDFHYETTVGASLPVIETLKDIVRTGDRVSRIEGSFSGTLGYLTNELMAGAPLAGAVRQARELGYTEPNPADDLTGVDVARKALILARELGLAIDLTDVDVEPLVPASVLEAADIEAFFAALESHEPTMRARIDELRAQGHVLRYLARIDVGGDDGTRVRVGPTGVDAAHPASRLRGTEAFVAFTTERHADYPLLVQGAGAGGAVTAAGVLADVLSVGQGLRGR